MAGLDAQFYKMDKEKNKCFYKAGMVTNILFPVWINRCADIHTKLDSRQARVHHTNHLRCSEVPKAYSSLMLMWR